MELTSRAQQFAGIMQLLSRSPTVSFPVSFPVAGAEQFPREPCHSAHGQWFTGCSPHLHGPHRKHHRQQQINRELWHWLGCQLQVSPEAHLGHLVGNMRYVGILSTHRRHKSRVHGSSGIPRHSRRAGRTRGSPAQQPPPQTAAGRAPGGAAPAPCGPPRHPLTSSTASSPPPTGPGAAPRPRVRPGTGCKYSPHLLTLPGSVPNLVP